MSIRIPQWLYTPNLSPSGVVMMGIILLEVVIALILWSAIENPMLPRPIDIWNVWPELFRDKGLGYHLIVSFLLFTQALGISMIISLSFAYLSRFALGYPVATFVGKLRFLGMSGLVYFFMLTIGGGHDLKLALLTFSITVFYTVGMIAEVHNIPSEDFDLARTLKMNEWQVLYEVVILGTLDKAIELLRQNAAMGWMMLTMVEGVSRTEGGVGTLLLNGDKTFDMSSVFALQCTILLVGIGVDYVLGVLKRYVPTIVHLMPYP